MSVNADRIEKILALCTEVGECIEWTHARNSGHHPVMRYEGRSGALVRRVLAELSGMPIEGRKILMRCNNPRCVNPEHYAILTQKQLLQAAGRAGRLGGVRKSISCAIARRATATLTHADVVAIRESMEPRRVLAERYGVCTSSIRNVRTGRTWRSQVAASSVFDWCPQ